MAEEVITGDVVDTRRKPKYTLAELNGVGIDKLGELIEALDAKSDPDMVRACVESLAKLNSSLKGSDILPKEETEEERREREQQEAISKAMGL